MKTQVSAKTLALDPKTHRLYLSAATPEPAAGATATKKGGDAGTCQDRLSSSLWATDF